MKQDYIKLVNPNINYNIKEIDNILKSKWVTDGKWVRKLEEKIKDIHEVKYAVATSSGTTAAMLLLKSLPFKVETIAMPAFTWGSIKQLVDWLGYKVKWVDINPDDWSADFRGVKADLYFPTYTFGNFSPYKWFNHPMIFDAAHCVGNTFVQGQGYGSFFSFSPAKAFTGTEGGMLITNDERVYEKAKYYKRFMGRMEEINAYIALQNLKKRKSILKTKEKIFNYYKEQFNGFGTFQEIYHRSNYNEIGLSFNANCVKEIVVEELKEKMDIRYRYKSDELPNSYSSLLYAKILMLPGNSMKEAKRVVGFLK